MGPIYERLDIDGWRVAILLYHKTNENSAEKRRKRVRQNKKTNGTFYY